MATAAEVEILTTGELAERYNVPGWLVRKLVDELGICAKRAGQYRLVASCDFPKLERELSRRKEKGPSGRQPEGPDVRSRKLTLPGGGVEQQSGKETVFDGNLTR